MGIFDNIEKADEYGAHRYLKPGIYELELTRLEAGITQGLKKPSFPFVSAEFKVVKSTNPEFPPDSTCEWFNKMHEVGGAGKGPGPASFKEFLIALGDLTPEEVTPALCEEACGVTQPMVGRHVKVEVYMIETKAKNPFSKHVWSVA